MGEVKTTVNYEEIAKAREAECAELHEEIFALRKKLSDADDARKNLKTLVEAHTRDIAFYKGQIDAYQYCMNCKR